MAELRVEKKQGGGMTWLWVLILLLVIGAVVWYVANSRTVDTDEVAAPATGAVPPPAASPTSVVDTVSYRLAPPVDRMRLVRA